MLRKHEYGLRQSAKDDFNSGSDQVLQSSKWTRITGTGTIREDGAGTAYSKAVGANKTAWYSFSGNGQNASRLITGNVQTFVNGVVAGIFVRITGARSYSAVISTPDIVNGWDKIDFIEDYGTPTSTAIGTITPNFTNRLFKIIQRGKSLSIDIDNGTLTGSITAMAGAVDPSSPSGLYYVGPALGLGTSINAQWTNFSVRQYPIK